MDFFQGILLFVISCLCSFLEHAKQIFLYLLHSNGDHENLAIVYPPLKVEHAYPHCKQSKEIEKCAYGNNEENEEGFESGERTLPLCFSSFELLKQMSIMFQIRNSLGIMLNIKKVVYLKMKIVLNQVKEPCHCVFLLSNF